MPLIALEKSGLPASYKALELRSLETHLESLVVVERPLGKPAPGEVLVRLRAAPVNPSDLMFLKGKYGVTRPLPTVPGFEGMGEVVAVGSLAHRPLLGRRVACAARDTGEGTWAEYCRLPAMQAIPLLGSVPDEAGASLIVNPLSAAALLETAERGGHRAFLQTAAASQLGRMLVRLAKARGVPAIHVVRRQEQVDALRALGAEHVLSTHEGDFDARAKTLAKELKATIAFEAIAGPTTGRILAILPRRSSVLVYGGLSEEGCSGIDPRALVFEEKSLRGFWLSSWIQATGPARLLLTAYRVQRALTTDFRTEVRLRAGLEGARDAIRDYAARMSDGKVLITP